MFATNIQEDILWKKSSETFKQNPRKIPTKKFIFSKVEGSKMISFTHFSMFLLKVSVTLSMTFGRTAAKIQNSYYK